MTLLLCAQWAWAEGFKTAGEGKTYSFQTLAEINASGVTLSANGYLMASDVTIAEGDKLAMDDGVMVAFANNVKLTIEGDADFRLSEGSVFKASDVENAQGMSIRIKSKMTTEFEHCEFHHVGLELMAEGATNIRHCDFYDHDGSTAAAVYFINAGIASVIEGCHFENCRKAAIGSAANASQPLTIKDCEVVRNSTNNGNIPQINITAASPLVISGCTITGNPANTMVGGIGISNFMSYSADVSISNCTISDNRYGIGLVGPAASISIVNNTLKDNRYETNPMNGGSGISLYDPYQQTCATITGNHIEGSLWGVTIIGCKDVNLGRVDVAETDEHYNPGGNTFKDNGNSGQFYDLYNNSTLTVYAQGNRWNVSEQTKEQIESVVFHKNDDASLGEVIFWPAAQSNGITAVSGKRQDVREYFYNLKGQRIGAPDRKGIYIQNGRKVVL